MIRSTASIEPERNFAVTAGGGASAFRPKSDHLSMLGMGILRDLQALRAPSRPPDIYAAPTIASATSATACRVVRERLREGVATVPYRLAIEYPIPLADASC